MRMQRPEIGSGHKILEMQLNSLRLLAMDADGVLTDGKKLYTESGITMLSFDARDGLGLFLLQKAGIHLAVITNDDNRILSARCADLQINHLLCGVARKREALAAIKKTLGISTAQTAYVGDDIWDIPAFDEAGISIAVSNAVDAVKRVAVWISERKGGDGAVREIADVILSSRGVDTIDLLGLH